MLIPSCVLWGSFGMTLFSMAIVCLCKGKLSLTDKHLWTILLVELYFLILCATVFCRSDNQTYRIELVPFWSYHAYFHGRDYILGQIVMNIIVFIPMGFLLGGILNGKGWWKAFLIGLGMSLTIEVLQFVKKCGISEVDDLIHNSLGFMIGWGAYCFLHRIAKHKNLKNEN